MAFADGCPPDMESGASRCGGLVYFEPRTAPQEAAHLVKIKKCKKLPFIWEKIRYLQPKLPKDATFNKYNIIIPIPKCKDDFSSFSRKYRVFSKSEPLLCKTAKRKRKSNRYVYRLRRSGAIASRRSKYHHNGNPTQGQPYKLLQIYRLKLQIFNIILH